MHPELDKHNLFKRGMYQMKAPPVWTGRWEITDWIKYIDLNGLWMAGHAPLECGKPNKHGGYDFKHTSCYGEMNECQNIQVCCEEETDDYMCCQGFDTWELAIQYFRKLEEVSGITIVQLETC